MVSFTDAVSYVVYKNPVSQITLGGLGKLAGATGLLPKTSSTTRSIASKAVAETALPLSKLVGSNYWLIRLAGVSGAAAVCLAAYGRHSLKNSAKKQEYLHIYESANQMHFIHSLALLAAPLTKRPNVSLNLIALFIGIKTGSLLIAGMLLFSGTCYYKAIKKARGENTDNIPAQLAPYGGVCLILGWLSMVI